MGCGNVSSILLPRSKEKSGGSKPLSQLTVPKFLYKCRTGCQKAMLPVCYVWLKKHCPRPLLAPGQSRRHSRFFAPFLPNMGRNSASMHNASHGWHCAASFDTLSKNSAWGASGATPQTEGRGGKIHLQEDCQGIPSFECDSSRGQRAWQPSDRNALGKFPENGWLFLGWLMYAIFVWIRAMITRESVKKPILEQFQFEMLRSNRFEEHICSQREEVREDQRNPTCRRVVDMGLLYLVLECILWRKLR